MPTTPIPITRAELKFEPDPRRVITRRFAPGGDDGGSRIEAIVSRVMALREAVVVATLAATYERFAGRHRDFTGLLEQSFAAIAEHVAQPAALSIDRRRLIGAYFTQEYSVEAAALSNPSMVIAPDQDDVAADSCRFVLSLRSIGEGHVSSIQFRSGVIDAAGAIAMEAPSPYVSTGTRRPPTYEKYLFRAKLMELHAYDEATASVIEPLVDQFTLAQLDESIQHAGDAPRMVQATRTIRWLATSNYETTFDATSPISERVIFPVGPLESHGMEDARFVRFVHDDGVVTYFATYTAYDGYRILPQLIETRDFITFRIATLNGPSAINKGIALFPRKIDGQFVALARLDNENNHLIRSDNVRFWHDHETLQRPQLPWELIQIGNSGSPIETEAGWIVLTHGVGPLRQYVLGAILLDLNDPARILGSVREPLLVPADHEQDGYVPNVVYSCGGMRFGETLVLPYGVCDVSARIATLRIDDLLSELTRS